MKKETSAEITY